MSAKWIPVLIPSLAGSWFAGRIGAFLVWNFIYSIGARVVSDETHYALNDAVIRYGGLAGLLFAVGVLVLLQRCFLVVGALLAAHALATCLGFVGGVIGWRQGLCAYYGTFVVVAAWFALRTKFRQKKNEPEFVS